MLAALMWGCGRSSSNNERSATEILPEDEAIEVILDSDVTFDECSLNEFAHAVSRNEVDNVEQSAYMLLQCQAAAHHLEQVLTSITSDKNNVNAPAQVRDVTEQPWFADFECVADYLNSATLPSDFAEALKDIQQTRYRTDAAINKYLQ